MDFILHVFILHVFISVFGISYLFGFLDELTKIEHSTQFRIFETAIEDSNELRFITRQPMLSCLYFSMLAYYSGIWTIKLLRKLFRFLILKNNKINY